VPYRTTTDRQAGVGDVRDLETRLRHPGEQLAPLLGHRHAGGVDGRRPSRAWPETPTRAEFRLASAQVSRCQAT
jgi:hypothetical protein